MMVFPMLVTSKNLAIAFRALLVTAMLVFGNSCALGNLDCASASAGRDGAAVSAHDDHDSRDGCPDRDGCDEHPSRSCAHGSICCSTWGPAAATPSLSSSSSFAVVVAVPASSMFPVSATEPPAPVPIPAESPPLLVSFLRL